MAGNESVRRNQLQLWLGFVGFFGVMSVFSIVGTLIMGRLPNLLGLAVAVALIVTFFVLLRRYRALG